MQSPLLAALASILLATGCASPNLSEATESAPTTGAASSTTGTSGVATGSTSEPTSEPTSGSTSEPTSGSTSGTGGEPGNLFLADKFLNIAHRGGGRLRPEETLVAFENALAVGADVLEFDLHASLDDVVVAIHDETVDRTTGGTGTVRNLSFEALRALDAGYNYTPDDGATFPYRGMGLTIPTLDEILTAFPDAYYLIELKQNHPSIVDAVVASLTAHDALERVVLASFSLDTIAEVRAAAPTAMTALSLPEMVDLNANLDNPEYTPPAGFVQSPWDLTSAELVDFAHAKGLKVHPWTVNDAATMTTLIDRGVDGIMTDDPALLAAQVP